MYRQSMGQEEDKRKTERNRKRDGGDKRKEKEKGNKDNQEALK